MKMIIDIPDNELKVPLRNIHLLISDGIVTEVCIKKYDKDRPYYMVLDYATLEECEDCISRADAIEFFKDDDYVVNELKNLAPVNPTEKVGQWINPTTMQCMKEQVFYYCSVCGNYADANKYCPNCGCAMKGDDAE